MWYLNVLATTFGYPCVIGIMGVTGIIGIMDVYRSVDEGVLTRRGHISECG
jgi:hypothetical protein